MKKAYSKEEVQDIDDMLQEVFELMSDGTHSLWDFKVLIPQDKKDE